MSSADVSGQSIRSTSTSQTVQPMKMGTIACPERSVMNYQSTLRSPPRNTKTSSTQLRNPETTRRPGLLQH
jgi:hypothetical protein